MRRYYTDKYHAFNIDGIRALSRSDDYNRGFYMSVTYKGNHFAAKYPTIEERDNAFNTICGELDNRNQR